TQRGVVAVSPAGAHQVRETFAGPAPPDPGLMVVDPDEVGRHVEGGGRGCSSSHRDARTRPDDRICRARGGYIGPAGRDGARVCGCLTIPKPLRSNTSRLTSMVVASRPNA